MILQVVVVVAVAFGLAPDWRMSSILSIVLSIPVFVATSNLREFLALFAFMAILVLLLIPGVATY